MMSIPACPKRFTWSLACHQLLCIFLVSTAITLISTAVQLYMEYRRDMNSVSDQLHQIESSHLQFLSASLWNLDSHQIQIQLNNMLSFRDISRLEIQENGNVVYAAGHTPSNDAHPIRSFPMTHIHNQKELIIGTLIAHVSLAGVYSRLVERTLLILFSQAVKTFLVSLCILLIIYRLVTRHIIDLSSYAETLTLETLDTSPFSLNRSRPAHKPPDELDHLAMAINRMRTHLSEGLAQHQHNMEALQAAESALAASNQLFTVVLDSIDAIIYVSDMDTCETLFMNRAAFTAFGKGIEKPCWEVFHRKPCPCSFCNNHLLVDPSGVVQPPYRWEQYYSVINKWMDNTAKAIEWVDGRTVRIVISTDITTRIEAEKQHKEMETALKQAQKMEAIGTLAGGIAHDFNNILGIILWNSELALDDATHGITSVHQLNEIVSACNRAREVVRQLLDFSRKSENTPSPTQLAPIIEETIGLLRASIPSSIQIRHDIQEPNGYAEISPTQIQQILINLCTNSAQAMGNQNGTIAILLSGFDAALAGTLPHPDLAQGDWLHLSVADDGPGILPDVQLRMFDPYFTTKPIGKGTGMGLSVVHGIVTNCGGVILPGNRDQGGARMDIYLPRTEAGGVPAEGKARQPVARGTEHILFVDDEPALGQLGKAILEREGYTVTVCDSPEAALEMFTREKEIIDLVITDMTMPGMTGEKLANRLFEIQPDIPIILSTGYSDQVNETSACSIGFAGYIEKPVDRIAMTEKVRSILDATRSKPFPKGNHKLTRSEKNG